MIGFNVCVAIALVIVLQYYSTEAISFGILKALISPPMPRVTRLKNINPRDIKPKDPFAVFDFLSLVKQYNYPVEEHNVTTIDGYKLIIHRIPGSPTSPPAKKKPLILLQHGFIEASDSYVLQGPGKDLVFLLVDAGFDVWLSNLRGNTYSRSHVVLKPEDPAFWQFNQHDFGHYDLPAVIDYALEATGLKNLTFIGYSMGTSASYILLSTRPEYNERMRLVVSLAPIAFWKHPFVGWMKVGVDNGVYIHELLKSSGIHEIAPQSKLLSQLAKALCNYTSITERTCAKFLWNTVRVDLRRFNVVGSVTKCIWGSPRLFATPPDRNISDLPRDFFTRLTQLLKYFPAGTSLNTLLHFYQNVVSADFRQFDYGYAENFQRYNQKDPPAYNLSKITAPVALFIGKQDVVATPNNVKELENKLPNVFSSVILPDESFNHIDFVLGVNAREILYDDIVKLVKNFN